MAIEPRFVRKGCAEQLEIALLPQFLTILISCDWVAWDNLKSQFYRSFWRSNLISCEKVRGTSEIAILPQFLAIEPHFVRKGCAGQVEIAILPQFLTIELHFVRKGCVGQLGHRNFTSDFGDRTSFRAKGVRGTSWNRNFTAVFDDRTSFRAKRFAGQVKSQFYRSFWRSNFISCERVAFRAVSLVLPPPPPSEEK